MHRLILCFPSVACCIASILISTAWLSLAPRLLEKQHRLISGRAVCVYVSEGGIRQVNLQRLQRAPVFILPPQVSKRELPVSALVMVWTVFFFQRIQRMCLCRLSSETSAGRFYSEPGCTLKQWMSLKPYS